MRIGMSTVEDGLCLVRMERKEGDIRKLASCSCFFGALLVVSMLKENKDSGLQITCDRRAVYNSIYHVLGHTHDTI